MVKHSFRHGMKMEEARRIADMAWESYRGRFERFGPSLEWIADYTAQIGFSAGGFKLRGAMEIKPGKIDISLDVPVVFRVFKKRAVSVIQKEIREWESMSGGENS
jgi:hypothetical protein